MKRDELIKLLTENYDADEEVTFLVNDSEQGEIQETKAEVKDFEQTSFKGHWELKYNGKTYIAKSFLEIRGLASSDFVPYDIYRENTKWVDDNKIHTVTKVLAIG